MDTILKKLLFVLLLLCGSAHGAITFVQSAHQTGTTTTLTVTFGATPSNNDLLICSISNVNNNVSSVTGGGGGSWTQVEHSAVTVVNDIWVSQLVSSGTTTLTVTYAASGSAGTAICADFSGVLNNTLDAGNTSTGTSTSVTSGSATTTANGDLVFAGFMENTTTTISSGPTNSFTEIEGGTGVASGSTISGAAYLIQGSSGAISTTWTTGSSAGFGGSIASYKAAAGVAARRLTLIGVGP